MKVQYYPGSVVFKFISDDDDVITEMDYVSADAEGNLFIEKRFADGRYEKECIYTEK